MLRRTPVKSDDQRHCCGGGDRGATSVDEQVIAPRAQSERSEASVAARGAGYH